MRIGRGCGCLIFILLTLIGAVGVVGGAVLLNLEIPPNSPLREYFPKPDGYNYTNVTVSAVISSAEFVADMNGQKQTSALMGKVGNFVDCMQEEGAFDSRVYVSGQPSGGIVFIIDVNRSADVLSQCILTGLQRRSLPGQPEEPQPCLGYGGFTASNTPYAFLFAATHQSLCSSFGSHFQGYGGTLQVIPLNVPSG